MCCFCLPSLERVDAEQAWQAPALGLDSGEVVEQHRGHARPCGARPACAARKGRPSRVGGPVTGARRRIACPSRVRRRPCRSTRSDFRPHAVQVGSPASAPAGFARVRNAEAEGSSPFTSTSRWIHRNQCRSGVSRATADCDDPKTVHLSAWQARSLPSSRGVRSDGKRSQCRPAIWRDPLVLLMGELPWQGQASSSSSPEAWSLSQVLMAAAYCADEMRSATGRGLLRCRRPMPP